jgi:hypothetical protein
MSISRHRLTTVPLQVALQLSTTFSMTSVEVFHVPYNGSTARTLLPQAAIRSLEESPGGVPDLPLGDFTPPTQRPRLSTQAMASARELTLSLS